MNAGALPREPFVLPGDDPVRHGARLGLALAPSHGNVSGAIEDSTLESLGYAPFALT
jgi:hypothetical protein